MILLPLVMIAADYVGTRTEIEPVTQQRRIAFMVEQDDRALVLGCGDEGSGELNIFIKPDIGEYPVNGILPGFRERFGKDADDSRGPWNTFGDDIISFDDAKLGSSAAKARWINRLANDTAYYVRFNTDEGTVTARFEYGPNAKRDIKRMLHLCKPKKVMQELAKMGSDLASSDEGAPTH